MELPFFREPVHYRRHIQHRQRAGMVLPAHNNSSERSTFDKVKFSSCSEIASGAQWVKMYPPRTSLYFVQGFSRTGPRSVPSDFLSFLRILVSQTSTDQKRCTDMTRYTGAKRAVSAVNELIGPNREVSVGFFFCHRSGFYSINLSEPRRTLLAPGPPPWFVRFVDKLVSIVENYWLCLRVDWLIIPFSNDIFVHLPVSLLVIQCSFLNPPAADDAILHCPWNAQLTLWGNNAIQHLETFWVVGVVEQYDGLLEVLHRLMDPYNFFPDLWKESHTRKENSWV